MTTIRTATRLAIRVIGSARKCRCCRIPRPVWPMPPESAPIRGNVRAGGGTRTPNLPITSRMRCQLRHTGDGAPPIVVSAPAIDRDRPETIESCQFGSHSRNLPVGIRSRRSSSQQCPEASLSPPLAGWHQAPGNGGGQSLCGSAASIEVICSRSSLRRRISASTSVRRRARRSVAGSHGILPCHAP